jgi:hypothetical protein
VDPPRLGITYSLVFSLLACQSTRSEPITLEAAVGHALATLPWDHSTSEGPVLCPTLGPCDTVWLEPRVVHLPHPAPAFFVPDARTAILVLGNTPEASLPGIDRIRRPVRYGAWSECLERRHDSAWPTYRRACVAIGVSGDRLDTDTLQVALLVLTPEEGLRWPRVRLTHGTNGGWRGELISRGGE